jgi:hypothetical protein
MRYSKCVNGVTTTVQLSGLGSRVSVAADGGGTATADITPTDFATRLVISVRAGQQPTKLRQDLMDAVFNMPDFQAPAVVAASIPLGDIDLLEEFHRRCNRVATRAAGSTCLVDASIEPNR